MASGRFALRPPILSRGLCAGLKSDGLDLFGGERPLRGLCIYIYIYMLLRGSALGDVFNMSESVQSVLIPIVWGFVNIFCPSLGV